MSNYFVFDMSVPDAVQCVRKGLRAYTRHSEHEPAPALYAESEGVWLDAFTRDWFTADDVRRHLAAGKRVCVVSPSSTAATRRRSGRRSGPSSARPAAR